VKTATLSELIATSTSSKESGRVVAAGFRVPVTGSLEPVTRLIPRVAIA
jgi:hypothetical protein